MHRKERDPQKKKKKTPTWWVATVGTGQCNEKEKRERTVFNLLPANWKVKLAKKIPCMWPFEGIKSHPAQRRVSDIIFMALLKSPLSSLRNVCTLNGLEPRTQAVVSDEGKHRASVRPGLRFRDNNQPVLLNRPFANFGQECRRRARLCTVNDFKERGPRCHHHHHHPYSERDRDHRRVCSMPRKPPK